ncbi:MAG TPA: carboxypeptidase-like regulatory domain-containing protein [Puia sp.]|nr:carboxypeptidase-like regulatory domain-containing protein [Puia sp.]
MKSQLVLFLFLASGIYAQTGRIVKGKVTNGQTGSPISNASVYFANTSKGVVTNEHGLFEIRNIPIGNSELVISFIGFKSQSFHISSQSLPLKLDIQLQPKVEELESVTVQPFEKNGWEKWGAFFLTHFIGTSVAARGAKIINYKTLKFRYSKESVLNVVASEPLIIENPALGYRIKYDLDEFDYDSTKHFVNFQGYRYFEDLLTANPRMSKRWKRNRKDAYEGSIMHFMRCLYNGTLLKNGFEVHRSILKGEDFFVISPNILNSDSLVANSDENTKLFFFKGFLEVIYKNAKTDPNYSNPESGKGGGWTQKSQINLQFGEPIIFGFDGNFTPPLGLFLTGYWAWSEKVGHILPLDYEPEETDDVK